MPDEVLTPLGELLEHARERVLHISARRAADRAGISGTRWRQVVTGVAWRGGEPTAVRSTPRTVVAMALAVEVDPAEALRAAELDVAPEAVEAIVRDLQAPSDQAAGVTNAAPRGLADEIERIRDLPIDPADKIRIVNTLIDVWQQKARQEAEEGSATTPRLSA